MSSNASLPVFPRDDLDTAASLLPALGSYWSTIFPQKALLEALCVSRLLLFEQERQDLLEAQQCLSRYSVPVNHLEAWSPLYFYRSAASIESAYQLTYAEDQALYGVPGTRFPYTKVFKYGEGLSSDQNTVVPLPDGIRSIAMICDRLTSPSVVMLENIDYIIDAEAGTVTFSGNLFDDERLSTRTVPSKNDMDVELVLWAFGRRDEHYHIRDHYGYAVNARSASSDNYRDLINAVYDMRMGGAMTAGVRRLLSAVADVPLVKETSETVEKILTGRRLTIVTDAHAYGFKLGVVPVVSEGDTVLQHDRLVDAIDVIDPKYVACDALNLIKETDGVELYNYGGTNSMCVWNPTRRFESNQQASAVWAYAGYEPNSFGRYLSRYPRFLPSLSAEAEAQANDAGVWRCPIDSTLLNGYFRNETVILTAPLIGPHRLVRLQFDLLVAGDWRGYYSDDAQSFSIKISDGDGVVWSEVMLTNFNNDQLGFRSAAEGVTVQSYRAGAQAHPGVLGLDFNKPQTGVYFREKDMFVEQLPYTQAYPWYNEIVGGPSTLFSYNIRARGSGFDYRLPCSIYHIDLLIPHELGRDNPGTFSISLTASGLPEHTVAASAVKKIEFELFDEEAPPPAPLFSVTPHGGSGYSAFYINIHELVIPEAGALKVIVELPLYKHSETTLGMLVAGTWPEPSAVTYNHNGTVHHMWWEFDVPELPAEHTESIFIKVPFVPAYPSHYPFEPVVTMTDMDGVGFTPECWPIASAPEPETEFSVSVPPIGEVGDNGMDADLTSETLYIADTGAAVTLNYAGSESGVELRYTLDGTTPIETSALYEEPIAVVPGHVLAARAFLGSTLWQAVDAQPIKYVNSCYRPMSCPEFNYKFGYNPETFWLGTSDRTGLLSSLCDFMPAHPVAFWALSNTSLKTVSGERFPIFEAGYRDQVLADPAVAGLSLDSRFLGGDFMGALFFPNKEVEVEYVGLDAGGRTEVRFELGGHPNDIEAFWEGVHGRGTQLFGWTLADYLTRTQGVISQEPSSSQIELTVNPMQLVLRHILGYNLLVLKLKAGLTGDNSLAASQLSVLKSVLPPHVTYMLFTELRADDELITAPIYDEVVAGSGPIIDEWINAVLVDNGPAVDVVEGVLT